MTDALKLTLLQTMTGESDEDILTAYLELAAGVVIAHAYPYRDDVTEVPSKYSYTQIKIANYLLNKQGAEGETAHSENGVSRTYENGDIPLTLLREIIPLAAVVSYADDDTESEEDDSSEADET